MKKLGVLVTTAIVAVGVSATSCDSKKSVKMKNGADSVSYALGLMNGNGFKKSLRTFPGDPVNVDILLAALEAGMKDDPSTYKMTAEEAQVYFEAYIKDIQVKDAAKAKVEGESFLAENKTKDGVFTTESGLQYRVEKEGTGAKPTEDDKVKVHYTGTLLDGTKFDSSVDRGEPAEFRLNQVIKGWTEGLKIMPVGSKYIFWIPSDLAYGEHGAGEEIKPNSVLKFEVELLEILK